MAVHFRTRLGLRTKRSLLSAVAMLSCAWASVGLAPVAQAMDLTCPDSGYACLYLDNDFHRNVAFVAQGSPQSYGTCGGGRYLCDIDRQMSSVRNRTSCTLFLYDGYDQGGKYISVSPHREIARIGYTYGAYWNDRIHSLSWNC